MAIDPDALRQARLQAGLSLAQVAGNELTRQAVHLIETGKVRPTAHSLQIIARRLGVPPQTFQVAEDTGAALPNRAAELERLYQRQRHQEVLSLGERVLAEEASAHQQAFAHLYVGRSLVSMARPDDALPHLRRARRMFEREDDPWFAAEAREGEAGALYQKEDRRAVTVAEDALRRYRALTPRRDEVEARMLEHLGTCLLARQEYALALRAYREALHVAGVVLDLTRLARIYHGMARCQYRLGEAQQAIELASRAVALYAVENDLRPAPARADVLPRIENDLGMLLMRTGRLDRAEEMFRSALGHLEQAGVERLQSHILLSLAELGQARGEMADAEALIARAIELAGRLEEPAALAAAHRQLAELHAECGRHELADREFDRALEVMDGAGMVREREECLAARLRAVEARSGVVRLEQSAG